MNKHVQFWQAVRKYHKYPLRRFGQNMMNALCEVDNTLYHKLVATDSDCYYCDSNIPVFMEELYKHWGEKVE
jgi:hypothetical protein